MTTENGGLRGNMTFCSTVVSIRLMRQRFRGFSRRANEQFDSPSAGGMPIHAPGAWRYLLGLLCAARLL